MKGQHHEMKPKILTLKSFASSVMPILRIEITLIVILASLAFSPGGQSRTLPTPTPTPTVTPTPTPTVTPTPTPTITPTPTPTPPGGFCGEDRGNGNSAGECIQALNSNTTGINNTATGWQTLFNNTSGQGNTATGFQALLSNTTANNNTAEGLIALTATTTGGHNSAFGAFALARNTTGANNTAVGESALQENTGGNDNTAIGFEALDHNIGGANNTAIGFGAMFKNTSGFQNVANGFDALYSNTTGDSNTADGFEALYYNTTGQGNTAIGLGALLNNTTGNYNIVIGLNAGSALTTESSNIDIGSIGATGESNTIRIGTSGTHTAAFIAGITGTAVTGAPVVVDGNGQLGVAVSSERFKDQIKPMNHASETILALRPVTFLYKKNIDPKGTPQFGLVAEQVEKVNPDLVSRDADGKVFTVRYDAVNAMLLNEFLKEHKKVEQLEANAVEQQREIKALMAGLKKQAALIQKVSDRIELQAPALRVVDDKR
jgi:hypothetical protein